MTYAFAFSFFSMARHVALKVVKSAPRYTETALDEIKLLQRLTTSSHPPLPHPAPPSPAQTHTGRSHVISATSVIKVSTAVTSAWSCIDDVESIIQSELASSSTAPSSPNHAKLTGVPPRKGRGCNQTPLRERIHHGLAALLEPIEHNLPLHIRKPRRRIEQCLVVI
ncbi:hypothetical protein DXG01_010728 [Tephrocybe rancida]|nr:hypothetical protein DXG01_010728 [Tephrocybe rancida]